MEWMNGIYKQHQYIGQMQMKGKWPNCREMMRMNKVKTEEATQLFIDQDSLHLFISPFPSFVFHARGRA